MCHNSYFGKENAPLKRTPKKASAPLLREMKAALGWMNKVADVIVAEQKSLKSIVAGLAADLHSDG